MGNFSRNTYDQSKNYISVRLQQGVPLVDADINELSDVSLQEIYRVTELGIGTGVTPNSNDWLIGTGGTNSFGIFPGTMLVAGRAVRLAAGTSYTTQPYADPARAAQVGIPVAAPLTTPTAARDDLVYLEIFEREVNSVEDPNLINGVIGIETSVRTKRDFVVRVVEGSTTLPSAPAGHSLAPLSILHRAAGSATISTFQDVRPNLNGPQTRKDLSIFPAFVAFSTTAPLSNWTLNVATSGVGTTKFRAMKTASASATGVLPLSLPDNATIIQLVVQGLGGGAGITFQLMRTSLTSTETASDMLVNQTVGIGGTNTPYTGTFTLSLSANRIELVDNGNYMYSLVAIAPSGAEASITGIRIRVML